MKPFNCICIHGLRFINYNLCNETVAAHNFTDADLLRTIFFPPAYSNTFTIVVGTNIAYSNSSTQGAFRTSYATALCNRHEFP